MFARLKCHNIDVSDKAIFLIQFFSLTDLFFLMNQSRSNRNDDRKDDFKEEKERLRKTNKALHEKVVF